MLCVRASLLFLLSFLSVLMIGCGERFGGGGTIGEEINSTQAGNPQDSTTTYRTIELSIALPQSSGTLKAVSLQQSLEICAHKIRYRYKNESGFSVESEGLIENDGKSAKISNRLSGQESTLSLGLVSLPTQIELEDVKIVLDSNDGECEIRKAPGASSYLSRMKFKRRGTTVESFETMEAVNLSLGKLEIGSSAEEIHIGDTQELLEALNDVDSNASLERTLEEFEFTAGVI